MRRGSRIFRVRKGGWRQRVGRRCVWKKSERSSGEVDAGVCRFREDAERAGKDTGGKLERGHDSAAQHGAKRDTAFGCAVAFGLALVDGCGSHDVCCDSVSLPDVEPGDAESVRASRKLRRIRRISSDQPSQLAAENCRPKWGDNCTAHPYRRSCGRWREECGGSKLRKVFR